VKRTLEEWYEILSALKEIWPKYEKMNKIMSLGFIGKLRKITAREVSGGLTLDLGSGNCIMEKYLTRRGVKIVVLDPLMDALKTCLTKYEDRVEGAVCGVAEKLPFRNNIFNNIIATFSVRDFKDLEEAFKETARVLKEKGNFIVLEIGKPSTKIKNIIFSFYWRLIVPFLAFIFANKYWRKYTLLYKTLREMPTTPNLIMLLKGTYGKVFKREFFFGGAVLIKCQRKSR